MSLYPYPPPRKRKEAQMPDVTINLTMQQIFDAVCPKCQQKILDLASQEGSKGFAVKQIRESLEKQLRGK